jgi:hypothetical protein
MMMRWNWREKKATLRKRFVIHSTYLSLSPSSFSVIQYCPGFSLLRERDREKKKEFPCLHLAAAEPITQMRNN